MVFGNVKGALSMAAVLALPQGIAYRERLIAIVFGVTLVTLVTQALPFRHFLTWLGVASRRDDEVADDCRAVLIGARRAQTELDTLLASGLISRHEHAERWAGFQRDIIEAERSLRRAGHDSHATWRCPRCSRRERPPSWTPRAADSSPTAPPGRTSPRSTSRSFGRPPPHMTHGRKEER